MKPNREGKPVVPGRCGYDIEFVEVTGPPTSMAPMPPAKSRGKLTPLGTGEGLIQRPAPDLTCRTRSKVPLVPGADEIAKLPRLARIAFAARCARRVFPAIRSLWPGASVEHIRSVAAAVGAAEQLAAGIRTADENLTAKASDAVRAVPSGLSLVAGNAAIAAVAAGNSIDPLTITSGAAHASADVAGVLFKTATIDTPLTAQLRCIRRDFTRLKKLARKHNWTDETPVPPEVFGPLWPPGVEPYWAVEPPEAKPPLP